MKIDGVGKFATKNALRRATGLSRTYFDRLEREGKIEVTYSGNTAHILVSSLEEAIERDFAERKKK